MQLSRSLIFNCVQTGNTQPPCNQFQPKDDITDFPPFNVCPVPQNQPVFSRNSMSYLIPNLQSASRMPMGPETLAQEAPFQQLYRLL